jgi:hypothetical protein
LTSPRRALTRGGAPQTAAEGPADSELRASQIFLNAERGQEAALQLGADNNVYGLGVDAKGFKIVQNGRTLLRIDADGNVDVRTDIFSARALAADGLVLGGMPQWRLGGLEVFNSSRSPSSDGWSIGTVLECPKTGLTLLCNTGVNAPGTDAFFKTYDSMPAHTSVRLSGTAHFIDDWQGEVAYLKANDVVVWTASHDQRNTVSQMDLCGSAGFSESRFSVPFDVTLAHTASTLKVAFGTTVVGNAALFGISALNVEFLTRPPQAGAASLPSNGGAK